MRELELKIENCFGIKKLNQQFSFTADYRVNLIYAKNGLMKTSFTKIFKKIQDDKVDDIKDIIFNNQPIVKDIFVDGTAIQKEEIFVINSFEKAYESGSISSLLINNELKAQLEEVLNLRNEILKNLEKKSGLKITKTSLGKIVFELEPQIINDFSFSEKSYLQNLDLFTLSEVDDAFEKIQYADIFDESVLNKKIKSREFQNKINEYIDKSNEIYDNYQFFEKGKFTLPKLKDIQKKLRGNNFFVKENKIVLNGNTEVVTLSELDSKIKLIENELKNSAEFKEIEKLLSDAKGIILKDIIETYPEILEELKEANLGRFRKKLWLAYLKMDEDKFNNLKQKYALLKDQIDTLSIDRTPWKEAIDVFNSRFYLPFKMDIDNLTSSIIGESLPKVVFSFCNKENIEECGDGDWVRLNRDELEQNDTLSQGEKRALYLLNIIFDIEKRRKDNQKTLFIIDDIADSFDYKNKYAIIEYLKDILKVPNFYMIILSHNFDFYRTIASRLDLPFRKNRFHAIKNNSQIKIEDEYYQNQPFKTWKNDLNNKKFIIALIPFIRNLIEYGLDDKKDYMLLTHLLHVKILSQYKITGEKQLYNIYNENNGDFTIPSTHDITIYDLKQIYRKYIGKDDFNVAIRDTDKIYDLIINTADTDISDDIHLENKIILALAIRLKAEEFMITKIKNSPDVFRWKNHSGNQLRFLDFVYSSNNQTRELFNGFSQIGDEHEIKILERVNIMTPEHIHINSFMYEPILDMDIIELKTLYGHIKYL